VSDEAAPDVIPEADLERLYGVPLAEFITARTATARRLRTAGQREAATAVGRLPKPTVAAWAVNQLARRHRDDLEALVEAGGRLRSAVEGPPDPAAFRGAMADERELLRSLVAAAGPIVEETGRSAPAVLERVRETLQAAAADEGAARAVVAGRLPRELLAVGIGPLPVALAAAPPPRARPTPASPSPGEDEDAGERRQREALAARDQARATLEERKAALAAVEGVLDEAVEAAQAAVAAADEAERRALAARQVAHAAERARRDAQRDVERRSRGVDEAARRLEQADAAVQAAHGRTARRRR
jgi:hypothetical protein